MPNMNGFDFLNQALGYDFDVIFTTAFDQYAIKAIRFSALDYLLKPIDSVELQSAINRHIIKQQNQHANQPQLIDNTRFIFKDHKPILISKTLGEYEEILSGHFFLRIHKSYLVNKNFIKKVDKEGLICMSDGKMLPFSKRRREAIMNLLKGK